MNEGNKPKKRKRTFSPTSEDSTEKDFSLDHDNSSNSMPYLLNRIKAIQKKIDATSHHHSQTEIKGSPENPQIVVSCGAAIYEIYKRTLHTHLKKLGLFASVKHNKDNSKSVVSSVVTVKNNKKGKVLYSINLFNTTSKFLINRISSVDLFVKHYNSFIDDIPHDTVIKLNHSIQQSCEDAITSFNGQSSSMSTSHSHQSDSDSIDLPSSASYISTNTNTSTTSPLLSEIPSTNPTCVSCTQLHNTVQILMKKIDSLEKKIERQSVDELCANMFNKLSKTLQSSIDSKLECIGNSIQLSINSSIDSKSNCWNYPLNSLKQNNINNSQPSTSRTQPRPSTNSSGNSSTIPQPANIRTTTSAIKSTTSQNRQHDNFKPGNNIVIDINKSSDTYLNYDQDNIRRTINHTFGPTIIEKISKYKFISDTPRIMIQLKDKKTADDLISRWDNKLFGGSKVRATIDPKTVTENTGMLKGVPIDTEDQLILNDINKLYPHALAERIYKSGKKLRLFKIKFADPTKFKYVINNGICLQSQGIKLHFEKLF